MITITELRCAYGQRTVLEIPSASFAHGVHGIVGLNGAGKTTFLNALYGFGRQDGSSVQRNSSDLGRINCSFLETENYFHPGITGREYLDLFMSGPGTADVRPLNELLEVPLDALITTYSTGMRRKLALLGVLALDRPVVLLDEPMNGLDLASTRVLEAIIRRLSEQGRTVFVTSHVLGPLVALCHRIHLLQQGRFTRVFERGSTEGLEQALFADVDTRTASVMRSWGGFKP